jgi:hypothetical protein
MMKMFCVDFLEDEHAEAQVGRPSFALLKRGKEA